MSSLSCPKAGGALFGSRRSHRAILTGYSGYLGYPTCFYYYIFHRRICKSSFLFLPIWKMTGNFVVLWQRNKSK